MSSQSAATSSPRDPFDDDDADIVFRSSDNVDFRLYKVIVAKASPVMRGMLTLPSDPSADAATPPVVRLTETARTLEHVFRLCSPVEHPVITTVEDVHAVLEAARKYEMAAVTANLRWIIKQILPKEPLRMYAIAYMLELEDVAREAAELLLEEPSFHIPSTPPPEFQILPSLAIYAVHMYRQKCVEAALRVLEDHHWVLNGECGHRVMIGQRRLQIQGSRAGIDACIPGIWSVEARLRPMSYLCGDFARTRTWARDYPATSRSARRNKPVWTRESSGVRGVGGRQGLAGWACREARKPLAWRVPAPRVAPSIHFSPR
ncbi:hypothetical protein C8T65DRAFT_700046 [Cerioporus squamosus]|nr:hypothetical protein C8T65DRAFT_700046 [Cerioporus squamosus]